MAFGLGRLGLQALRDLAKQYTTAASKKISYNRRIKGVDLADTDFDPRQPVSKISRYNTTQLRSYINRLETFTDRTTQFIAGSRGRPIRAETYRQIQQLQNQYGQAAERELAKLADIRLPQGQTIGQRETITATRNIGRNATPSTRPYSKISYRADQIMGQAGAEKLLANLKKRTGSKYLAESIAKQKQQALQMARAIGDRAAVAEISRMNRHQFNVFWNYTNSRRLLGFQYDDATEPDEGNDPRFAAQVKGTTRNELGDLLSFARGL